MWGGNPKQNPMIPSPTYELLDDLTIVQEFMGNTMTVCTCASKSTGLMVLYSLREFDSFYRAQVSTNDGSRTIVDPLAAQQRAKNAAPTVGKKPRRKKDETTDRVPRAKRSLFGLPLDDPKDQPTGG